MTVNVLTRGKGVVGRGGGGKGWCGGGGKGLEARVSEVKAVNGVWGGRG